MYMYSNMIKTFCSECLFKSLIVWPILIILPDNGGHIEFENVNIALAY